MFHMTPRDLVRRWYGQVKGQPISIAHSIRMMAAHTIIPSVSHSSYSPSDFVPLSGVLDLVLTSEVNTSDEVVGTTLRAYGSSYDPSTNTVKIGGAHNFRFERDLMLRPYKNARGRVIDSDSELSLLLASLDLEAEREAAFRRPQLMRTPRFAEAVLSFDEETAPTFTDVLGEEGLKRAAPTSGLETLAWHMIQPSAPPTRSMYPEIGFKGRVKRVVRDLHQTITVVELDNDQVFEIPDWAVINVRQGQEVDETTPIGALTLPRSVVEPIYKANRDTNSMWAGVKDYIGKADARLVLRSLWDSEVTHWAGMVMIPNHILDISQTKYTTAVWRDLRGVLNREVHNHLQPQRVMRWGEREGQISVWDAFYPGHGDPDNPLLKFDMLGGHVDLESGPYGYQVKPSIPAVPYTGPLSMAA